MHSVAESSPGTHCVCELIAALFLPALELELEGITHDSAFFLIEFSKWILGLYENALQEPGEVAQWLQCLVYSLLVLSLESI